MAGTILVDLAEQLAARGVDVAEWCRGAACDPSVVRQPNERVPGSMVGRLWREAVARTGDELLGLHVAEAHRPGAVSALGVLFQHCRTGRDALDRLARYAVLLNDGLAVELDATDTDVTISFVIDATRPNFLVHDSRHVIETMAAGVMVTLRRLVPRPFAARDVLFRHAAGTPRAEYTRIFGGLVRFGGDVDRLVLARADLDVPIPTADRALLEVLDGYVARQVATLDTAGPTTRRVLDALDGVDAGMLPDIEVVGRMLAVSPRHLQRLLASEGTSFRVLADAMMRARAETLLVRRGLSASEVALVLGFSEASAFTRAFRRWTGTTPAAWAARRTARIET